MLMTRLTHGRYSLFSPADDGGGGGGGNGDGKSKGKGKEGEDPDPKEEGELSEAMKKEIAKHVNGAVANYAKRMQSDLTGTLTTLLDDKLKAFQPPKEEGEGKGKSKKDEEDPEKKKLRADLDKVTMQLQEQQKERERERDQSLRNEERGELTAKLREACIPEHRIKGAVAYLLHDAKVIRRNKEDNSIVWPVKRDWGEEELPFTKGVDEWLTTEEGKSYLPAKSAAGSGHTGGKPKKPGEKQTAEESASAIASFVLGNR